MVDKFAETVKMSTYILAFAVLDDFRKVRRSTRNTKNPIEVRIGFVEELPFLGEPLCIERVDQRPIGIRSRYRGSSLGVFRGLLRHPFPTSEDR